MVNSLQQNSEMCWKLWPKARGARNAGGRCKGIERQLPQLSSTLPHCPHQREALVELRTCNESATLPYIIWNHPQWKCQSRKLKYSKNITFWLGRALAEIDHEWCR